MSLYINFRLSAHSSSTSQSFSYPEFQYYKAVSLDNAFTEGDNAVGALYAWNGEG